MNEVLRPMNDFALTNTDDIVVFRCSWEVHFLHLGKELEDLWVAGLTITQLGKRQVDGLLGFPSRSREDETPD